MPKVPSVIKEKASQLVTQENSRFISYATSNLETKCRVSNNSSPIAKNTIETNNYFSEACSNNILGEGHIQKSITKIHLNKTQDDLCCKIIENNYNTSTSRYSKNISRLKLLRESQQQNKDSIACDKKSIQRDQFPGRKYSYVNYHTQNKSLANRRIVRSYKTLTISQSLSPQNSVQQLKHQQKNFHKIYIPTKLKPSLQSRNQIQSLHASASFSHKTHKKNYPKSHNLLLKRIQSKNYISQKQKQLKQIYISNKTNQTYSSNENFVKQKPLPLNLLDLNNQTQDKAPLNQSKSNKLINRHKRKSIPSTKILSGQKFSKVEEVGDNLKQNNKSVFYTMNCFGFLPSAKTKRSPRRIQSINMSTVFNKALSSKQFESISSIADPYCSEGLYPSFHHKMYESGKFFNQSKRA